MSTSGTLMVAWIVATPAGSLILRLTPLCDDGSLGFASISRRNRETPHSRRDWNRIARRYSPEGWVQVRHALNVRLWASLLLFAGLSLFPCDAAFGAAQASTRPSETNLDRVESLLGRGKLDEAIILLENLRQKNPPPGIEARLGKAYYKKR